MKQCKQCTPRSNATDQGQCCLSLIQHLDTASGIKIDWAFTVHIQSTLVISNSLIWNNRLSQSENLVPVLTERSTNRQQNIVEKRRSNFSSFPQYFQYISNLGVKLHIHSVIGGRSINCFPQFRKSDMSK